MVIFYAGVVRASSVAHLYLIIGIDSLYRNYFGTPDRPKSICFLLTDWTYIFMIFSLIYQGPSLFYQGPAWALILSEIDQPYFVRGLNAIWTGTNPILSGTSHILSGFTFSPISCRVYYKKWSAESSSISQWNDLILCNDHDDSAISQ